jgi:hypothetical protein
MAIFANAIAVNFKPGNPFLDVIVAIRKGIDNAARNGADFGIRVTVSYISQNATFETLDTGRLSITTQTILLGTIDNRTVSIDVQVPFGAAPIPGGSPNYSPTAQVLHRDPTTNTDVELGPAE